MKPFEHYDAKTIEEAVELLKKYEGKARVIAGGTDLLPALKDDISPDYPEVIVNIKTVPNLDNIEEDEAGLRIGVLAKLIDIAESPTVKEKYKLLALAAEAVATPQIRRMGTVGGNLCQDLRCWYYRYPQHVGGRVLCYLKGGMKCYALTGENQYHSIFGGYREADLPPLCSSACPGNVDIPSYLDNIREGNLHEAAKTLLDANPIPAITGRVCPHHCEQQCNRNEFDETVSIRDIERFVGDYIFENANEFIKKPKEDTGKKAAIIGSGPAGLSAAYYLRKCGHAVTVFDRMEEPGGMLTYGIPAFRLPKNIVSRVIKILENMGIQFRLKTEVGKDVTLSDLKRNFDCIFIATGAWSQPSIQLEGKELTKPALEFLIDVHRGAREVGKKVLVIGGGNVAVTVGLTALRLGAKEVTLACLESRDEMPAFKWEIEQALEEGVKLMTSWGPHKVLETKGKVTGMELIRCTSVFDSEGRFAPKFDPSVKTRVEADQIILAVGQTTDLSFIDPELPLKLQRGLIVAEPENQKTSVLGIFAGGDVTTGAADVIKAVAAGRRAALAMNHYLTGMAAKTEAMDKKPTPLLKFNSEYLKKTRRITAQRIPISKRGLNIEDTPGLSLSEVETEANRCFNCGCLAVNSSDIAVALVALDAKVKIAGSTGSRIVPIEDFFISPRKTLAADEIVTEIHVPKPPETAKQTFLKFRIRSAIDFPIVSVASLINMQGDVCKDAKIVLGAVAPIPLRAKMAEQTIKGKILNAATVEAASETAVAEAIPLNMNTYKLEITKTLVKRALLT